MKMFLDLENLGMFSKHCMLLLLIKVKFINQSNICNMNSMN